MKAKEATSRPVGTAARVSRLKLEPVVVLVESMVAEEATTSTTAEPSLSILMFAVVAVLMETLTVWRLGENPALVTWTLQAPALSRPAWKCPSAAVTTVRLTWPEVRRTVAAATGLPVLSVTRPLMAPVVTVWATRICPATRVKAVSPSLERFRCIGLAPLKVRWETQLLKKAGHSHPLLGQLLSRARTQGFNVWQLRDDWRDSLSLGQGIFQGLFPSNSQNFQKAAYCEAWVH